MTSHSPLSVEGNGIRASYLKRSKASYAKGEYVELISSYHILAANEDYSFIVYYCLVDSFSNQVELNRTIQGMYSPKAV